VKRVIVENDMARVLNIVCTIKEKAKDLIKGEVILFT